ncbi:MAG TPA: MBOAT family O-acyltransferase [Oligoflexia bacterium]|nr:MBOAT family O-acyltransferase [Oligoflexia bacterium]
MFFTGSNLYEGYFAEIVLPIGISFYTFQGMSAVIDAYRREFESPPSLIDFGMYLSAFPQLIAGPIVRFVEIKDQIRHRSVTSSAFYEGSVRFCFGLSKKVLLADSFARIADSIFSLPLNELSFFISWFGVFSYALQIYFDFSAYSDMAIGIGLALGFRFPENFNNPYRATSITDFWRRWHMTLSRWFRDYLYIPLGGNRMGAVRTYLNLYTVFFLCGFWHGASYNFILWGLYHGTLLTIERIMSAVFNFETKGVFGSILTFVLVLVGWAIFRSDNLNVLSGFLGNMFSTNIFPIFHPITRAHLTTDIILIYFIAIIMILFSGHSFLVNRVFSSNLIKASLALVLLVLSLASIAGNEFHPFIYFRF